MKITVIGAGNTGIACMVHLLRRGYSALLYTRDEDKSRFFGGHQISSAAEYAGEYSIPATADWREALEFCDLVIIATWANAHREILENIYRICDRDILIFNGNWGAYEAYQVRRNYFPESKKTIAESGGMPYVASWEAPVLRVKAVKKSITAAAVGELPESMAEFLREMYGEVILAGSIFETSLAAPNPIIHIPLSLFNLSRIEHHESFPLLTEGFSENAGQYIMGIDKERAALAEALQVPYEGILQQLNGFWGSSYPSLKELFANNPVYRGVKAPDSIAHRFIAEDLPYGIAPLVALGELLGISVPYCRALTEVFGLYLPGQAVKPEAVSFTGAVLDEIRAKGQTR